MPPTKRKRRTKHRGTAAGNIQTRGRTGRPPTKDERKQQSRMTARERRMNTPPSWRSSLIRAVFAAGILFVFLAVTTHGKKGGIGSALIFAVFALALYAPAGYYLELFLYRRRQRKKETSR